MDPATQLNIRCTHTTRSVLATFGIIGQLIRTVNVSIESSGVFNRRIMRGKEPLVGGINERIIRLCGKDSDLTHTSYQRNGEHIVPVIEDLDAARRMIPENLRAKYPFFIHIENGAYGKPRSWSPLIIYPETMLKSSTGKHILCMEADATSPDSALGIEKSRGARDLTIEEATQAFKHIELRAEESLQRKHFRSLRVYLGDIDQTFSTGGGSQFTLRDRVKERKEVDVLVDSAAPVLKQIVEWEEGVPAVHSKDRADGKEQQLRRGWRQRHRPSCRKSSRHRAGGSRQASTNRSGD